MNRKIILLALCSMMVLAPMLFGNTKYDVLSEPMPKLESIKIVPVQNLPKVLDQQRQEDSLYYCNNLVPANAVGFSGALDWEGAMRLTPTELGAYAGWNIIAISWYHWGTTGYSQNVKVYDEGTPTSPGPVLTTEPYTTSTQEWVRVDLSNPVTISGSGDLWCSIEISQTAADFVIGVDDGPAVDGKGDWIYYSGSWDELQNLGLDYNWHILAIVEQAAVSFWDFETGWQGWTHTNGLAFPEAWDVLSSGYQSSWTPPDAGDSTMWIDSDSAGIGVLVQDTALSPVVVPPTNMSWLKYGLGHNNLGDWVDVGLKYFDGAVWNIVTLKTYTVGFGPAWDSIDVFAYAGYDSVQVFFYYEGEYDWYAGFDNVELKPPVGHDVGCIAVTSPPGGGVTSGDYDVIGQIHNFGGSTETFDVTAGVWDTTGGAWTQIFDQTVTLTDFPVGGDSLVNFGLVTFADDSYYYTEIVTLLVDDNPANDTAFVYSWTALALGDIVFVIDTLSTITGYPGQYGLEFDGTYFYVSSAYQMPNAISVIDTLGNLVWSIPNGTSTLYGMRDLAWDGVYAGPDRIDTLYASDEDGEYSFGIDLTTGTFDSYTPFTAPAGVTVCRALGWDDDDGWFFTANWDPLYKFTKDGTTIQGPVTGPGSCYGCAYDTDDAEGHYVWWHGQTGPYSAHLTQMNPADMTMTGVELDIPHTILDGIAGGLCFYEGFRGMDVLFALIQGEGIYGIFVRWDVGVEEEPIKETPLVFGLNKIAPNPVKDGATVTYTTAKRGPVSLKVYDSAGRLVRTLIDSKNESAGYKTVYWDGTDDNHRSVAAGVYFYRLTAENKTASDKMIVVR